jgi:hypothetical protein
MLALVGLLTIVVLLAVIGTRRMSPLAAGDVTGYAPGEPEGPGADG